MSWARPRILVVAGSPALCCGLEELLRAYGYDVAATTNREMALRLGAGDPYTALLLDRALPVLDAPDQGPPVQRERRDATTLDAT